MTQRCSLVLVRRMQTLEMRDVFERLLQLRNLGCRGGLSLCRGNRRGSCVRQRLCVGRSQLIGELLYLGIVLRLVI